MLSSWLFAIDHLISSWNHIYLLVIDVIAVFLDDKLDFYKKDSFDFVVCFLGKITSQCSSSARRYGNERWYSITKKTWPISQDLHTKARKCQVGKCWKDEYIKMKLNDYLILIVFCLLISLGSPFWRRNVLLRSWSDYLMNCLVGLTN